MKTDALAVQAERSIPLIRQQKVILDFDLARLYGVETRALKQAVRLQETHEPLALFTTISKETKAALPCPISASSVSAFQLFPRPALRRFPPDFVFQLSAAEAADLRFQFGTSNGLRGGRR